MRGRALMGLSSSSHWSVPQPESTRVALKVSGDPMRCHEPEHTLRHTSKPAKPQMNCGVLAPSSNANGRVMAGGRE